MNPELQQLQLRLDNLEKEFYRNNFIAHQDFNKSSKFTSRLSVPHYATNPATCEVGEIIEVGGKLKICSASDTWSIVGTQS